MWTQIEKFLHRSVIGLLIFQLIGCGTLLYPERRGQKTGRIDVGIVLLDAIGLLFFLIPGIVAFAVDFSNGAIYLPATTTTTMRTQIKKIQFNPKTTTLARIEKIIEDETGHKVRLTQSSLRITRLNSKEQMLASFDQAGQEINQYALAK